MKNWRPISLLNTDFKIIAHILANRMQAVLPDLISKDQCRYIKTRITNLNFRSIIDVINEIEKSKSFALLAFLDFVKAFDKLNCIFFT